MCSIFNILTNDILVKVAIENHPIDKVIIFTIHLAIVEADWSLWCVHLEICEKLTLPRDMHTHNKPWDQPCQAIKQSTSLKNHRTKLLRALIVQDVISQGHKIYTKSHSCLAYKGRYCSITNKSRSCPHHQMTRRHVFTLRMLRNKDPQKVWSYALQLV